MFSHLLGLNFEVRENVDAGIVDYDLSKGILNVIYQPLRRNRTTNRQWPLLKELSRKYQRTENQIILNWLVSIGTLPITKSENIAHIDEILSSLEFKMEQTDIDRMTNFRPPNYKSPKFHYGSIGEGYRVDQLSNVFDEEYDKIIS